MLERIVSRQLNLENRNNFSFNVENIKSLSEVTKNDPFLGGERIVSVVDLDGVLCEYGKKHNIEDNLSRLFALKDIISKSEEFVFYSSRIELNENGQMWKILKPIFGDTSITRCPFIVRSSIDRLENFAKKANENCVVESKIGFRKMRSCFGQEDDFLSIAEKTFEQNKKLVMVGSSIFDRQIIKQIVKKVGSEGVYYFDTGHFLI